MKKLRENYEKEAMSKKSASLRRDYNLEEAEKKFNHQRDVLDDKRNQQLKDLLEDGEADSDATTKRLSEITGFDVHEKNDD